MNGPHRDPLDSPPEGEPQLARELRHALFRDREELMQRLHGHLAAGEELGVLMVWTPAGLRVTRTLDGRTVGSDLHFSHLDQTTRFKILLSALVIAVEGVL
jgi:hypothetical protein